MMFYLCILLEVTVLKEHFKVIKNGNFSPQKNQQAYTLESCEKIFIVT